MPAHDRIAIVTGANKGIGLAIVRQLALQYPSSPSASGSLLVYLTARDKARGEEALRTLSSDPQLKQAKALVADGGRTELKFKELDIAEEGSVDGFAAFLREEHPEGVDIVVNNAGVAMQGFDNNIVKQTLRINYHGTLHATTAFLPIIRGPHGRLVNVASMSGHLSKYPPSLRTRFQSARTPADITKLMDEFTSAVAAGNEKEQGWPSAAYAVSKAGVIGMTRAVAKGEGKEKGVGVFSCCPGYVRTDMTRGGGAKTPDQGAMTPVGLALGSLNGDVGGFWQHEKEIEW